MPRTRARRRAVPATGWQPARVPWRSALPQPKPPGPGAQRPACGAEERCMPDETLHLPLIQRVLAREKDTPGALLPILHAIQEGAGYIPALAIPEIAHALNLSQAEVHGVISFYH